SVQPETSLRPLILPKNSPMFSAHQGVANETGDLDDPTLPAIGRNDGFGCVAQDPGPTSIPVKLKDGYLVVAKGSIGPLNDLTFLLDTGTSRTLIDSHIAKQLQLQGPGHKLTVF